jgi:16S rRNA (adenine1518-N6/adenine1519-N6)-dimethyltransferase
VSKRLPKADKKLGQHFLISGEVINSITENFKDQAEAMVEVGPGPGILTEYLAKHDLPFHVIEKDKRFPELLSKFIKEDQITSDDALDIDLNAFFKEKEVSGKKIWLVSNLPYNVGSLLLINFIQASDIKYMTLMFQKEVADKVVNFVGKKKKSMGSLLCLSQTYFDVEVLCQAPPSAFEPPPKVDSTVISFVRKENPVIPLEEFLKFESFLRKLFKFKRKQVGGVLKSFYPAEKMESAFAEVGVKRTDRAEIFELETIQKLYEILKS